MTANPPKPATLRIAQITQGMRVVTPTKKIARVEGIVLNTGEELHTRVSVRYLHDNTLVQLQAKLLRPYIGPPVVFDDEREGLRKRHGDVPLPPRADMGRDE